MARVEVEDDSGRLTCIWFNARFFREEDFPVGREMLFTGKVDFYRGLQMVSPEHELADEGEVFFGPRILPIYPLTEDLNQNCAAPRHEGGGRRKRRAGRGYVRRGVPEGAQPAGARGRDPGHPFPRFAAGRRAGPAAAGV